MQEKYQKEINDITNYFQDKFNTNITEMQQRDQKITQLTREMELISTEMQRIKASQNMASISTGGRKQRTDTDDEQGGNLHSHPSVIELVKLLSKAKH